MRCALCRGRTPGRFKTLCTRCHFVKEAMAQHGVETVLAAIRRSVRELRTDKIATQLPPSAVSPFGEQGERNRQAEGARAERERRRKEERHGSFCEGT